MTRKLGRVLLVDGAEFSPIFAGSAEPTAPEKKGNGKERDEIGQAILLLLVSGRRPLVARERNLG